MPIFWAWIINNAYERMNCDKNLIKTLYMFYEKNVVWLKGCLKDKVSMICERYSHTWIKSSFRCLER